MRFIKLIRLSGNKCSHTNSTTWMEIKMKLRSIYLTLLPITIVFLVGCSANSPKSWFAKKQYENASEIMKNGAIDQTRPAPHMEVHFDFDSAQIDNTTENSLNSFIVDVPKRADVSYHVTGYSCNIGQRSYNLELSENRAKTVKNHLVKQGLTNSKITTEGLGENYPRYSNETENTRSMNRRAEIMITVN